MIRDPHLGRRAAILFATALTATQACSAGRDVGTNPTPSITISISPASATVVLGASVEVTATITGHGGFAGTGLTFDLTDAPDGVSFKVFNLKTSGSITTATITTSVAATVEPGTYTINLTANGTGVRAVSVPFTLTIPATIAPVGFTLSANPAALTTCESCSAQVATITINRTDGFTGSVTLFVTIPVTGGEQGGSTTATLNPTSTTGNSSILAVTTSAAPGNYTITITGTAPGFATQTITIAMTVQ